MNVCMSVVMRGEWARVVLSGEIVRGVTRVRAES